MKRAFAAIVVAGCSTSSAPPRQEPAAPAVVLAGDAPPAGDASLVHDAGPAGAAAAPPDAPAAPPDAPRATIVDAPMKWPDERARLTLEYRRRHSDAQARDLAIEPKVIVLHYTGGSSAKGTRGYFDNPTIEASRAQLAKAGKVNVSAHFVVDRDGTIYRLQPETRFARHCIGLNHLAIGIENVGDGDAYPLTDAQVAADAALVRDLVARFPITHLLGHHEVMAFKDHPYYVELDPTYANDKPDPGAAFMAKVRAQLTDLALEGGR